MTPPAAPPRDESTVGPAPPAAMAAGVLAGLGALVLLYLAFLVFALGGLSSDGADRVWALLPLAAGVAAAVALSLAFGALLQFTSRNMTFEEQEVFGGTLSIVAVVFDTWMVLWMRKAARHLRTELDGRMRTALAM